MERANSAQAMQRAVARPIRLLMISSGNKNLLLVLFALCAAASAAELQKKTTDAFNKYVSATEARINNEVRPGGGPFLYVDSQSPETRKNSYERLRNGEILIEKWETKEPGISSDVPDGLIHHWVGLAFIPGATLSQVIAVAQDYESRDKVYKPEVTVSRLIWHQGDDFKFFLRVTEKRFVTAVFNTEYASHWVQVDPTRLYTSSISTRIAEVKDPDHPDGPEWPVGQGRGYLWRLNSYWRFQEKDEGVYLQCEAVSLTRDIPFGLGWLLRPLVTKLPREALNRTLGQTRAVVLQRAGRQ